MVAEKFNLGHVFYMDLWPVATSFLMIQDPDVAAQLTQTQNHPKHPIIAEYMGNLTGEKSILTAEGTEWKTLRSMLAPSFTPSHLTTFIPSITDHVVIFRDKLQTLAKSRKAFSMQPLALAVTADVISLMILGKTFNVQRKFSSIIHNFDQVMSVMVSSTDIIARVKGKLPKWWYCRQLDREIGAEIRDRHNNRATHPNAGEAVVDLLFQAYQDNKLATHPTKKAGGANLDPDFMRMATDNVKTLIIAGYETTANTIAAAYYLISLHPDIVHQLREEHSSVFAPTVPATVDLLKGGNASKLLAQLPLTTAVIKETLRLYPPASTTRAATSPTETLTYRGRVLPLANHALWISLHGISRSEDLFPDPSAFKPARFLPDSDVPPPPKDAWRPFEKGPRSCIGQELAMMEIKIVLLLTLREFDFESLYHHPRGNWPAAPEKHGGRAYQMIALGPKPAGGVPMRVRMRGSGHAAEGEGPEPGSEEEI